jgi:hypothetical protein
MHPDRARCHGAQNCVSEIHDLRADRKMRGKSVVKYYTLQILAASLVVGSFKFALLAFAEYGKWVGWATFIVLVVSGYLLHKVAYKLRDKDKSGSGS